MCNQCPAKELVVVENGFAFSVHTETKEEYVTSSICPPLSNRRPYPPQPKTKQSGKQEGMSGDRWGPWMCLLQGAEHIFL